MTHKKYHVVLSGKEFWGRVDSYGFVQDMCGTLYDRSQVALGPARKPPAEPSHKRGPWRHPIYWLEVGDWTYAEGANIGKLLELAQKKNPSRVCELRKETDEYGRWPKTQIWRVA